MAMLLLKGALDWILAAEVNKKLSYRRETARQLLTRCFSAVAV